LEQSRINDADRNQEQAISKSRYYQSGDGGNHRNRKYAMMPEAGSTVFQTVACDQFLDDRMRNLSNITVRLYFCSLIHVCFKVSFEVVANKGKESAENLRVG
jgi:hypothetical protein